MCFDLPLKCCEAQEMKVHVAIPKHSVPASKDGRFGTEDFRYDDEDVSVRSVRNWFGDAAQTTMANSICVITLALSPVTPVRCRINVGQSHTARAGSIVGNMRTWWIGIVKG